MFLQVKKEQIINGLQKAANIIPSSTGAAYLRSLWIKADAQTMIIMSTDANLEFTGIYDANISKEGSVGINGRHFVDLLRKLPAGEITLRLDEQSDSLVVEQNRRNYRLPISEPTWFQPLAPFPDTTPVVWSGDYLQDAIDKTLFCVGDTDGAEALGCLYIRPCGKDGKIDISGLNGHQFALLQCMHDELASKLPEEGILLPRKYVVALRKWLNEDEIELNFSSKRLFVRSTNGQECLSLPRSAYLYPDYSAFLSRLEIPESSRLELSRQDCCEALDRLLVFNTESDRCTTFSLNPTSLVLSSQGQNTGCASEFLDVAYNGTISRIAFPTKNLLEIFSHYDSPQVTLTLTGEEGPCGITGEDDPGYTVLIMPMKMTQEEYYSEDGENA